MKNIKSYKFQYLKEDDGVVIDDKSYIDNKPIQKNSGTTHIPIDNKDNGLKNNENKNSANRKYIAPRLGAVDNIIFSGKNPIDIYTALFGRYGLSPDNVNDGKYFVEVDEILNGFLNAKNYAKDFTKFLTRSNSFNSGENKFYFIKLDFLAAYIMCTYVGYSLEYLVSQESGVMSIFNEMEKSVTGFENFKKKNNFLIELMFILGQSRLKSEDNKKFNVDIRNNEEIRNVFKNDVVENSVIENYINSYKLNIAKIASSVQNWFGIVDMYQNIISPKVVNDSENFIYDKFKKLNEVDNGVDVGDKSLKYTENVDIKNVESDIKKGKYKNFVYLNPIKSDFTLKDYIYTVLSKNWSLNQSNYVSSYFTENTFGYFDYIPKDENDFFDRKNNEEWYGAWLLDSMKNASNDVRITSPGYYFFMNYVINSEVDVSRFLDVVGVKDKDFGEFFISFYNDLLDSLQKSKTLFNGLEQNKIFDVNKMERFSALMYCVYKLLLMVFDENYVMQTPGFKLNIMEHTAFSLIKNTLTDNTILDKDFEISYLNSLSKSMGFSNSNRTFSGGGEDYGEYSEIIYDVVTTYTSKGYINKYANSLDTVVKLFSPFKKDSIDKAPINTIESIVKNTSIGGNVGDSLGVFLQTINSDVLSSNNVNINNKITDILVNFNRKLLLYGLDNNSSDDLHNYVISAIAQNYEPHFLKDKMDSLYKTFTKAFSDIKNINVNDIKRDVGEFLDRIKDGRKNDKISVSNSNGELKIDDALEDRK